MHTGLLDWQNLATAFAFLRKRLKMIAHRLLCISQKHTVLLLNTQPRTNIREEYYLRISSSFFGSGLLRLCLGLCLFFCFCFCRSLCLGSSLCKAPTSQLQSQFSYSVLPGTWKLPCFLKIKIFSCQASQFPCFPLCYPDRQASQLPISTAKLQGHTQCHTTLKYTKCRIRLTIASQFPFWTGHWKNFKIVSTSSEHTQID